MSRVRFLAAGIALLVALGILLHARGDRGPRHAANSRPVRSPHAPSGEERRDEGGASSKQQESKARTDPADLSEEEGTLLDELDSQFCRKVMRLECEIGNRLNELGPSAGFVYLQELLSAPAESVGFKLSDTQVRRVLAAGFLAWVVDKDPALGDSVLRLTMTLAESETDRFVRGQLLGAMMGTLLSAGACLPGGEGFSAQFEMGRKQPWMGALSKFVQVDAVAMAMLERIARTKFNERSRGVVLGGLARMESERARTFVLSLFREDRTSRFYTYDALARRNEPAVLDAFVDALGDERNGLVVSGILKGVANSSHARAGWGRTLKGLYERLKVEPQRFIVGSGNVVPACARVFAMTQDGDALDVVMDALRSPADSGPYGAALSSIQRNPHASYAAELTRQLPLAADPYTREKITYALKKIDPNCGHESVMWDVEQLTAQLKQRDLPAERRKEMETLLAKKRAELESLRRQR